MKKHFSTICLTAVFLVGLSVLLYPTISNYINQKHQSEAIADYDASVAEMSEQDYSAYFDAAEQYNQKLRENPDAFYEPDQILGYEDTLNVSQSGIMGYITIDKLDVHLPIYHGTSATVLEIACGHLKGSSLPIGGESTHSVLSAHRGLPSAKLFTDLDKMEVGDTFTVTILNRVLTYEVDQISIVQPSVTESLQIEEGKDLCTLMTCTPYGINSERLLVRGRRVETEETKKLHVPADAFRMEPLVTAPFLAVPLLLGLLIGMVIRTRKKR